MSDSGEPAIPGAGSSRPSEPPGLNCSRTSRTQTKCWHCGADGAHRICFGCMKALYCDKHCQKCGWKAADGHRAECLQWVEDKNCWYCNTAGAACMCVACDKARYCDPDCREKGKAQHSPKHCTEIRRPNCTGYLPQGISWDDCLQECALASNVRLVFISPPLYTDIKK